MDKFVRKESSNNQSLGQGQGAALDNNDDNDPTDGQIEIENIVGVEEVNDDNIVADVNDSFQPDIFDPRYWDSLDHKQIDILAQKGPRRDLSITKGPKDRYFRRFSALFYTRILSNGEHCDRDWLVYSKELDRVFCFGCKLFTKGHRKGQLANGGFNDWIHLGIRLKEHEISPNHVLSMTTCYELHSRLQKDQTIDKEQMSLIIRYVDSSSSDVRVEESFIGFLDVNDTTGQGLFDVLENELKLLGLDIDDVRGQGYDNGSNMKGKHKGVKKKLLDRIYTTFANSTKKWQILKDNISRLTLKSVSATRWESHVESVKSIRFQCTDIREALLQVSDVDNDPKTRSEAKGLANNELGEYEFIVAIVIWYEVLYAVNLVSKHLQAKDMLIDVTIEKVEGLISFFKERSFSKLKLLKSYLRSTMTQQRLNDLATIALESGLLEKIDYEHIIEDFISRNTKRMKYFN
uniref:TTF-type domain-containing protein n=1 Tax=Setaria viridis TaxID=4556 RepID=A0A4U6WKH7_SETVI|nr:hypothetical protein SEVIR_1G136300v2 [Setaria viridis]